jgi:hypothetical protein
MFHVKALAYWDDGAMWVETLVERRDDALAALAHEHPNAERFSPVHVTGLPPLTSYVASTTGVDKNNSIEIEQRQFGDDTVRVFLDRTSGRFWEDQHESMSDSLFALWERVHENNSEASRS